MQNDWVKWLSGAEFSVNNAFFSITLASPFLANSGQNSCLEFKPSEPLPAELTAQVRIKLLNVKEFTKKMKEFTEHLQNEILITQIIYEFSINQFCCLYLRYFVKNQVWLNVCNLSTAHSTVKLDNWHVSPFSIKHIFKKNSLIIELKLPAFIKIHSVFHAFLLSHVATNPLPGQQQEPWEPIIAENGNQAWYINCVLNFKLDRQYSPLLLKYYIN